MLAALVAASSLVAAAPAGSAAAARGRDRGPRLTVSAAALRASLHCSGRLAQATRAPILLVPGTTLDPVTNFSWNYERAFTARGWPWCAVTLPGDAMADAQQAGEYVVSAIRTMHARAGRRIAVVGYSQGGMLPRWALKYWPDTRADVSDDIGIDPSNHGTLDANGVCSIGHGCAPSLWQQRKGSAFLTALNAGPQTWPGIDYTVVYSRYDEVVPQTTVSGVSALPRGAGKISDIEAQQVCPTDVADHLAMGTYDPVAYAVVTDALTHAGPAEATRVPASTCHRLLQPGVDTSTFATHYAHLLAQVATVLATYPHVSAEPALASYAR